MDTFNALSLPDAIKAALQEMNFVHPTPIQQQTIPVALSGKDILGSAQTGTGKTLAYILPLVAHLLHNVNDCSIVLVPTRELAIQVFNVIKTMFGKKIAIYTALLIGGDPMHKQFMQLRQHPRVIVGTPGRVNDHLLRGSLKLNQARFVVFDEMDRMLDMGFSIQLQEIAKFLPSIRQTLMFSATVPSNIEKMAQSYLKDPMRISIGESRTPAPKVQQQTLRIGDGEKYQTLLTQLDELDGSSIIFVKTKIGTEELAMRLRDHGHSADAIHGDLRQKKREQVIRGFRNGRSRILVATDVVARGLDVPHIECVVNYDLPQCPEDYIHRIGRTGRAGAEGKAINLISGQDRFKWRDICRMMGHPCDDVQEPKYRSGSGYGKKPSPKPFGSSFKPKRFSNSRGRTH